MAAVRIIPRLDIKGPNLVKGIHLEGLRVLGVPEEFAQFYYENGADELFYMDVVASLYERNGLHDIIQKTARNVFIPITVGGGIRNNADVRKALQSGADKVCINTGAVKNPQFIKEAAEQFGSSTIVVALEAIKQNNGEYLLFMDNAREHTGLEVLAWAKKMEAMGAGELVLTSVDKEGTGEGYDLDLITKVASKVNIPVIAHGGAKNPDDVMKAIKAGAHAVSIASILHYETITRLSSKSTQKDMEGNRNFLNSGQNFKKITGTSITEIKKSLRESGIECRI